LAFKNKNKLAIPPIIMQTLTKTYENKQNSYTTPLYSVQIGWNNNYGADVNNGYGTIDKLSNPKQFLICKTNILLINPGLYFKSFITIRILIKRPTYSYQPTTINILGKPKINNNKTNYKLSKNHLW
jgi:hypothetical protein